MSYFVENIIYLREQKGLTQQKMSEKLSEVCHQPVNLKRWQKYEEGLRNPPPFIIAGLCQVLEYYDVYKLLTVRLNK